MRGEKGDHSGLSLCSITQRRLINGVWRGDGWMDGWRERVAHYGCSLYNLYTWGQSALSRAADALCGDGKVYNAGNGIREGGGAVVTSLVLPRWLCIEHTDQEGNVYI